MPPAHRSSTARGIATVVLTLAGWSSVPLFLFHFAPLIDPWTSNGWRYGFSALLWLPVVLVTVLARRMPRAIWAAALVPSLVNAAGQVLFTWAHYRIDPGLLTFGLRTQLIFVALGAWLLFPSERRVIRTAGYLVGMVLLLVGTLTVVSTGEGVGQRTHAEGVALAIGSGLLFACYGLAVRRFMAGFHPVLAFGVICQYTGLAMLLLMIAFGAAPADGPWAGVPGMVALSLGADQFGWLLLSAVAGIALGHVFYYIAIANLGVAVTAGVLQLQPFLVAIGQLWFFERALAAPQWVGGFIAVAGALCLLEIQRRVSASEAALATAIVVESAPPATSVEQDPEPAPASRTIAD
jgi:drug/metabolite transporter (DMT)-like permease